MNRPDKFDEAFANSLGYTSYERQHSTKFTPQSLKDCSKVKARDIVDGWPKGRSTSVYSYEGKYNQFSFTLTSIRFVNDFSLASLIGNLDEVMDIVKAEKEFVDEFKFEKAYHREQQRIADEFIRLGKPMKEEDSTRFLYMMNPIDAKLL